MKWTKYGHKQFQKRPNSLNKNKAKFSKKICQSTWYKFENFIKYMFFCSNYVNKGLRRYYFLSNLKKAKWPNHFITSKLIQKWSNQTNLAFWKAKWQPWFWLAWQERERVSIIRSKTSKRMSHHLTGFLNLYVHWRNLFS
jgi:hypothetical protein